MLKEQLSNIDEINRKLDQSEIDIADAKKQLSDLRNGSQTNRTEQGLEHDLEYEEAYARSLKESLKKAIDGLDNYIDFLDIYPF